MQFYRFDSSVPAQAVSDILGKYILREIWILPLISQYKNIFKNIFNFKDSLYVKYLL